MTSAAIYNFPSKDVAWGNGLGFRITKPLVDAARIELDTELSVSAQPGRIVIETRGKLADLKAMLAEFDPGRHSGEVMAVPLAGHEVIRKWPPESRTDLIALTSSGFSTTLKISVK